MQVTVHMVLSWTVVCLLSFGERIKASDIMAAKVVSTNAPAYISHVSPDRCWQKFSKLDLGAESLKPVQEQET